jgi:hypothetical protein
VTSWSKLGTVSEGVSLDTLLDDLETSARHLRAVCDGGYDTNLPLADVTGGKAWVARACGDRPLAAEQKGTDTTAGATHGARSATAVTSGS